MSDKPPQAVMIVSASPHLESKAKTAGIMWLVALTLLPTVVASTIIFGIPAFLVIATSVAVCVVTEILSQLVFKRKVTVADGSAVVTGILLAFTLPSSTPLWMVALGAVAAIFLVKQLFGGLGYNIFNPALAARAILLSSFPVQLTTWIKPLPADWIGNAFSSGMPDAVTSASYLGMLKEGATGIPYSMWDLFMGTVPGSLGETCKLTLLIGAAVLLLFRVIDLYIPLAYIGSVALLSLAFGRDPLAAVLSGGLILGAFFMATDLVTTPTTRLGKLIFGLGCGIITALIRSYGGFPEGVCYSILLMNCCTPLLDKLTRPRVFGTKLFAKAK